MPSNKGFRWSKQEIEIFRNNREKTSTELQLALLAAGFNHGLDKIKRARYRLAPSHSAKDITCESRRSFNPFYEGTPLLSRAPDRSPCRDCTTVKPTDDHDTRICAECGTRATYALANHRIEWDGYDNAIWEAFEIQSNTIYIPEAVISPC